MKPEPEKPGAKEPGAKSAEPGKLGPGRREDYRAFRTLTTRWMDNDVYGHVNNVIYYSFFDTVVNQHLIEAGALDIHDGGVIGLVVETQCRFFAPLAFPGTVTGGLRVAKLGRTSVRYEIGLFAGEDETAAAEGHFVHVYVDRASRRPAPLPARLVAALQTLRVD